MVECEVPRIKICGVTSLGDAHVIVDAGADALGLIYASSVRGVDADVATDIVRRFSNDLWCVGVFRHQTDQEIVRIVERDKLPVVQLHDTATENLLDALATRDVKVIRAVTADTVDLTEREKCDVVAVLIDGTSPGSGVAQDWSRLHSLHFDVPTMIAGGLDAQNVGDVIAATSPWGVDVASGVEQEHGVKDPAKVVNFVFRARAALSLEGER